MLLLELGLKVFVSYLAGSVNGALLIGRLYGGVDIRKVGSGNAGGTNALRTQGKLFAFLVIVVDVGKGILPAMILPSMEIPGVGIDPAVTREWLLYGCAAATIFGHCYPVWHDFAGGKGAATAVGALSVVAPVVIIPALLTWLIALLIVGYVGLATVLAAAVVPVYLILTVGSLATNLIMFTTAVAVFIAFTHRSNLRRLFSGNWTPDIPFSLLRRSR